MAYTKQQLRRFDDLTRRLSSPNQMIRMNARFAVSKFQKEIGEAVCEEMFKVLQARDANRKA